MLYVCMFSLTVFIDRYWFLVMGTGFQWKSWVFIRNYRFSFTFIDFQCILWVFVGYDEFS